jgi:hypothetical protein
MQAADAKARGQLHRAAELEELAEQERAAALELERLPGMAAQLALPGTEAHARARSLPPSPVPRPAPTAETAERRGLGDAHADATYLPRSTSDSDPTYPPPRVVHRAEERKVGPGHRRRAPEMPQRYTTADAGRLISAWGGGAGWTCSPVRILGALAALEKADPDPPDVGTIERAVRALRANLKFRTAWPKLTVAGFIEQRLWLLVDEPQEGGAEQVPPPEELPAEGPPPPPAEPEHWPAERSPRVPRPRFTDDSTSAAELLESYGFGGGDAE